MMIIEKIYSKGSEFTKEEVNALVKDLNQQLIEGKITNWHIYADHDYDGTNVVFEITREETEEELTKRQEREKRNAAAQYESMIKALRDRGFKVENPNETEQEKVEREWNESLRGRA